MEFIARCDDCARKPSGDEQDRRLHLPVSTAAQRTPKQGSEDRVLHQMSSFTDEKLNSRDGFSGNIRLKPVEQRPDDSRGVLRRHQIGRSNKNYAQPD